MRWAEARDNAILPADFDARFAAYEANRRVKVRLLIVSALLVILAAGIGATLFLRHLEFLNRYACADNSGSWIDGHCQALP